MKTFLRYAPLMGSCVFVGILSACTPVGLAAGAGATVGIASAQEGGVSQAGTDLRIKTEINDLWFRSNVDMFRKLNITVDQGRVLLTGVVQNPEHRVEAVRLAWQPKGVKQVINEIRVADGDGIPGYVRDTWITTQLRTKMTIDRDIQSINYSIDTVQGIVYLMGVARSREELNDVTEHARSIANVRQVVSYVKMLGEPVQTAAPMMGDVQENASSSSASTYGAEPIPLSLGVSSSPTAVTAVPLPP
jgi:osmotically-inducible protein OsmY